MYAHIDTKTCFVLKRFWGYWHDSEGLRKDQRDRKTKKMGLNEKGEARTAFFGFPMIACARGGGGGGKRVLKSGDCCRKFSATVCFLALHLKKHYFNCKQGNVSVKSKLPKGWTAGYFTSRWLGFSWQTSLPCKFLREFNFANWRFFP